MQKNIISIMKKQHRTLQEEIGLISELLANNGKTNRKKIFKILMKFKHDLVEHLKLENDVFYVNLLKEMREKGKDISKTKEFISEMTDIQKVVIDFLEKFKDSKSIENKIVKFKKKFVEIGEILSIRIESEEEGIFPFGQILLKLY